MGSTALIETIDKQITKSVEVFMMEYIKDVAEMAQQTVKR